MESETMTEGELAQTLADAIAFAANEGDGEFPEVRRTTSFQAAGLLTSNDGFVLELEDGSAYQITVVRSR